MRYYVTCKIYTTDKRVGFIRKPFDNLAEAQVYYDDKVRACQRAHARELVSWEVAIDPI